MFVGHSLKSDRKLLEAAIVSNGKRQAIYFDPTVGRHYVIGVPGTEYEIEIKNLTDSRILVLSSVDGRNTLEDEAADHSNTGRVLPAWETQRIVGFALNDDSVRRFKFGTPEGSVSHQATGSTSNVGVIGLGAYEESYSYTSTYRDTKVYDVPVAAASSAAVYAASFSGDTTMRSVKSAVGTHMGEQVDFHVNRVNFVRKGAIDPIVIGYDLAENLERIITPGLPDPWPGKQTGYGRYQ